MQLSWSRFWTRVAVSISYDDNHYTTGTSKRRWLNQINFLFLYLVFVIIRINIIVNILKSIITIIITTIIGGGGAMAIVYVTVFSNFIVYKLFLVFEPLLETNFF